MKLPRRHAPKLFALFMASCMSCLMSAFITFVNLGAGAFPHPWLHNWGLAFCVALPCVMLLAPIGQRFVARFTI